MIFHFTVFVWSLAFLFGLELIAINPIIVAWDWYIFSILPLIVVSLIASRRITKRFTDAFVPGLLSLAVPTLLLLIDHPTERQLFVMLSAAMYYFALLGIYRLRHAPEDKTAQAFLNTAAIAALFFFYAGVYGFYLNFSFPLWGLMLLYFFGTALMSYETFVGIEREGGEPRRLALYSVLLGSIMGEMAWVMSFWPFGYLTAGVIALIFFFLAWDISFDAFHQTLSLKKAVVRILFFLALLGILLASTPWRILV
ncbi:MAG: hypothetical protein A3E38_00460 [Candidatus Moranbacteria bacterium RIFCSPHIGHO2_12_FULL_54_9]|nr:MAG: hypothetical protein A2878_01380 [Candidatus Moranbacteria bacterium RIFCSPHIGHO2_01_FULL_54_31]OGI24760.1 MAG: hypothetical protein A3E38_00460 [Candidatus Moranbacteria bacterium RIFCSPHIGHO2_12_FULL_54_9]